MNDRGDEDTRATRAQHSQAIVLIKLLSISGLIRHRRVKILSMGECTSDKTGGFDSIELEE